VPREVNKQAIARDMLTRIGGSNLQEIMAAPDWQARTIRGFIITLIKKPAIEITGAQREGDQARSRG
jgi:hypothetical protein